MNGTKNIWMSIMLTPITANNTATKENSNTRSKQRLLVSRVITAAIVEPAMVPITIIEAKVIVRLGFGLTARIIVITIQKSLGSPSTSPIV